MSVPNVLVSIGYAPNDETLNRLHTVKPKYLAERKFYSCRQNNDYLKYVNYGIAEGDFIGYAGNPEKSSGLFDAHGLLNKEQLKNLRAMLRATDSNIWHAVISFTEQFGSKYMTSYKDALELLQSELPKFFKNIGIASDNVVWYAGLHENTDNQHIHLGFFEKEPRFRGESSPELRYRFGTIPQDALNAFRIAIEERLTDANFDIKRSRRILTDSAQDTLFHLHGWNDYERELKKKLLALYRALPTDGRISYGSKNMDALRPQIVEIVNFIIRNNPGLKRDFDAFCADVARFDLNRKRICEDQKIENTEKYLVGDKYIKDIYRRLGDKVIKAALDIKKKGDREVKRCRSELTKKRAEKQHRAYLLERAVRIGADVDDEAIRCFEEYRRKLAKAEYDRLVDEGVIEAE